MRTRRRILQGLAALLSACGGRGEVVWFNDTGVPGGSGTPTNGEPPPTPYSADATGWTLLLFGEYPDLLQDGGYVYVVLGGVPLIITAGSAADSWVAMNRICTHQACQIVVNFGRIACPCHGSLWDDHGKLIGGPARNQDVYPTYGVDEGVWVQVPVG